MGEQRREETEATPYRTHVPMLALAEPPPPRGLVRANGSHCTCSPPGLLYVWWFSVQPGDRWYCRHGWGWERRDRPCDAWNDWMQIQAVKVAT